MRESGRGHANLPVYQQQRDEPDTYPPGEIVLT